LKELSKVEKLVASKVECLDALMEKMQVDVLAVELEV
jgi:hypothetical protein